MRFQLRPGFCGANLALADHYSVPWDKEDHLYSLWNVPIDAQARLLDAAPVAANQWHTLKCVWSLRQRSAQVSLNGKRVATLPLRKETAGANYLRIRSTAPETDAAGMWVESVEVKIANR